VSSLRSRRPLELVDADRFSVSARQQPALHGPFKNKNRTRLGIVSQLLEIAKEDCYKTHLMFGANLSFRVVSRYIDLLVSEDLLKESGGDGHSHRSYRISDRGLVFLETYYLLESFFVQTKGTESSGATNTDKVGS